MIRGLAGVTVGLIAVLAGVSLGGEDLRTSVHRWKDAMELDPRILTEINCFYEADDESHDPYAEDLARGIRRLVFASAISRLDELLENGSSQFIDVSYPSPGFAAEEKDPPERESAKKFEGGFIRTEALAFFETDSLTPRSALQRYTSPDFRQSVSSRIARIWEDEDGTCVETGGIGLVLSPTSTCSRIDELHIPGLSMQHSQVVSNPGGEDYQTVYFKESLKTFVAVPDGLVLHYVNYTRATDMGRVSRLIGRKKIKESQGRAIQEMQRLLDRIPQAD